MNVFFGVRRLDAALVYRAVENKTMIAINRDDDQLVFALGMTLPDESGVKPPQSRAASPRRQQRNPRRTDMRPEFWPALVLN